MNDFVPVSRQPSSSNRQSGPTSSLCSTSRQSGPTCGVCSTSRQSSPTRRLHLCVPTRFPRMVPTRFPRVVNSSRPKIISFYKQSPIHFSSFPLSNAIFDIARWCSRIFPWKYSCCYLFICLKISLRTSVGELFDFCIKNSL